MGPWEGGPGGAKWLWGTTGRRLCHYRDSALVHQSTRVVRSTLGSEGLRPSQLTTRTSTRITPDKDTTARGVRLTAGRHVYTEQQQEKLKAIHARLTEARRELDALIGDAYLRPRANIVPVHFLDLASATEKLRWAEKEWRELEREVAEQDRATGEELDDALAEVVRAERSRR
jgi:hypothetical protein